MMRIVKALLLLAGLAASAKAGPYTGTSLSTSTGYAIENVTGYIKLAASSNTYTAYTIIIDGVTGKISVGSATVTGLLRAGTVETSLIRGVAGGGGVVIASATSVTDGGGLTVTYNINGGTLTIAGLATMGSAGISGGLTASSVTVSGGGGLLVTYGISGASITLSGVGTFNGPTTFTAPVTITSSFTVTGGGGIGATYGVKAASATFGSGATISTFSTTGALTLAAGAALTFDAGALADSTVYGQDIAASTITLNKLNQNAAALNQLIGWNGSQWVPQNPGAGDTVLASTQIFSGGNSLYGSTTFYGTVNFNKGIEVSTIIALTSDISVTATNGFVCAAGSTGTIITSEAGHIAFNFHGVFHPVSGATVVSAWVLLDGAFISPFTASLSNHYAKAGATDDTNEYPADFFVETLTNVAAGTHATCVAFTKGAGSTSQVRCGTTPCLLKTRKVN